MTHAMHVAEKSFAKLKNVAEKEMPDFKPGDTVAVHFMITETGKADKSGKATVTQRVQIFQGVCIARKNNGKQSTFTVRKESFGDYVEKIFPLYSPLIQKIELVRPGRVRRAKLTYLRSLSSKKARIAEDLSVYTKRKAAAALEAGKGAAASSSKPSVAD